MSSITRLRRRGKRTGNGPSPETDTHYTKAELKHLELYANAPVQYQALARYYGGQRESYLLQAAKANKDWAELNQNVTSHPAKYPTPADWARTRYE